MQARKYFGTDGIRGRVGESLINAEFFLKLGWAVGTVLGNGHRGKVLIGKDTRVSGYMLESALEAGLSAAGMNIHLLGPMPTPAIAYLTRTFRAKAGIVISASHNLYHDNGIKFFSDQGFKLPDEIEQAIEAQLDKPMVTVESARLGKAIRVNDAQGRYIEFCKSTFPTSYSLTGMKIVVDCAHGAAYYVAPHVFKELGAQVYELCAKPDGFNINADCGATNVRQLQEKVLEKQADVGIALDGDGDRLIMVDHKGEVVDGDELLFIIAKDRLKRDDLQGGVVGTSMSNLGFENALTELKVPFKRAQVGDRHVMVELKNAGWLLGGEPSGHIVNLGLTTTGDGIISALQVLRAICQSEQDLHTLKHGMHKYPQVLINVAMKQMRDVSQEPSLKKAVKTAEEHLGARGRILLRPSGTEPVIRVMVEGEDYHEVKSIAQQLADVVNDLD